MSIIEPCPTSWCEHADKPYTWQGSDDRYVVICADCQVHGPCCDTEAEAIAAWNTRSNPDRNAVLEVCEAVASVEFLGEESVYQDDDLVMISVGTVRKARAALTTTPEPTDPAGVSEMADELERLEIAKFDARKEVGYFLPLTLHADLLAALRTPSPVLEVAKEALERFASRLEVLEDACRRLNCGTPGQTNVLVSDLRRAAAALQAIKEGEAR